MIWLPVEMNVPGFIPGRGYYLGFGNVSESNDVTFSKFFFIIFCLLKTKTARFCLSNVFHTYQSNGSMPFYSTLCQTWNDHHIKYFCQLRLSDWQRVSWPLEIFSFDFRSFITVIYWHLFLFDDSYMGVCCPDGTKPTVPSTPPPPPPPPTPAVVTTAAPTTPPPTTLAPVTEPAVTTTKPAVRKG